MVGCDQSFLEMTQKRCENAGLVRVKRRIIRDIAKGTPNLIRFANPNYTPLPNHHPFSCINMDSLVGDGWGCKLIGTDTTPLPADIQFLTGPRGVLYGNLCIEHRTLPTKNVSSSSMMKPLAWNPHSTPPEPSTTACTTHQPPKQQPSARELGFLASRSPQGPQRCLCGLPKITPWNLHSKTTILPHFPSSNKP